MAVAVLHLAIWALAAAPDDRAPLFRLGGDPSPGVLVNRSPGRQPFDPPDPSRPTVVVAHGLIPASRLIHMTMSHQFAAAMAHRGGTPVNLLSWDWSAASLAGVRSRANDKAAVEQGIRLANVHRAWGLDPSRTHLIGHSSGAIVVTAAARVLTNESGRRIARLTLLDPAESYHDVVFEQLAAGSTAEVVENCWAPGLAGFGRAVPHSGVRNLRVGRSVPRPGQRRFGTAAHFEVVHWYLETVADPTSPGGFNWNDSTRSVP
jgi:pimeloyl-ACP methyl ester carboxylesterase